MISNAPQHAKFRLLVRHLRPLLGEIPIDAETIAVGLLERLWHLTASSAIRGDIGRLPNDLIAEMIGWHGDADKLIDAFVECRWIDRSDDHRLLIHDWYEHAPKHVKGNAAKLGGLIPTPNQGQPPKAPPLRPGPKGDAIPDQGEAPKDGRTKPNQTKPNPTQPNQDKGSDKSAPCVSRRPPTVDEVRLYCETMNLAKVDPNEFHDHYTAAGWKLKGGQPMKDWQATARNWQRRDFNDRPKTADRTKGAIYDGKPIAQDF